MGFSPRRLGWAGQLPARSAAGSPHQIPRVHIVGISTRSTTDISFLPSDLVLDGYFPSMPRPEDLIVGFPRVTANYLCDTNALRAVTVTHLNIFLHPASCTLESILLQNALQYFAQFFD